MENLTVLPDGKVYDSVIDQTLDKCECDNTHKNLDTVCRYCYAHGRRQYTEQPDSLITSKMTVREMLDWLDGQGLVITDYDELEVALKQINATLDSQVRVAE